MQICIRGVGFHLLFLVLYFWYKTPLVMICQCLNKYCASIDAMGTHLVKLE